MKTTVLFVLFSATIQIFAQSIPAPVILEVKEDDNVATIYWNSKTDTYVHPYDPWKQQGIFSYVVEWGKVNEGFTSTTYTPFRVIQCQPLEPDVLYQARVYALDNYGRKSAASATVQFQHDASKVAGMRNRLTGFFDDFNLPMGAFDELKWNQSYAGCSRLGHISQHINNQFHAHNVLASGPCDRGFASSRPRAVFDFTNRTGTIEYDLDGSMLGRQRWFLDLSPADKKHDLSGHVSLLSVPRADPAFLLRISNSNVQLANADGQLIKLPNMHNNGACGPAGSLDYCPGENLVPVANVRRHFKIELSKTHIKIFINDILVVDGSLITDFTPNGLPYEVAQVNWVFLTYDTKKENLPLAMLHWDNFGFDAPAGWQATEVVHNYTDGHLETNMVGGASFLPNGMPTTYENPAQTDIPIPDSITDQNGNLPIKAELMFTLQGYDYQWSSSDFVSVNNTAYPFEKPVSNIPNFPFSELISAIASHSVVMEIDPNNLFTGNNIIQYNLDDVKILNAHIELTYPVDAAPSFTQPTAIYNDYIDKLMEFKANAEIGPNLTIPRINGILTESLTRVENDMNNHRMLLLQTPVSGLLQFDVFANSNAQLGTRGVAKGISHYNIYIDEQLVQTVYTNAQMPVSHFQHVDLGFDTRLLSNGTHYLFVEAYDVYNRPSVFDLADATVTHGEYLPIKFTVNNSQTIDCITNLTNNDLTDGNNQIPLGSYFSSNSIETNGKIALGSTVSLQATNQITLNSGFKVEQGGSLIIKTQNCPFE